MNAAIVVACVWFFVALATTGYCVLVRRRRTALAGELHELRQALTAARLMIDVINSLGETGPEARLAAADEMACAYHAMIAFERRLYAPLLRLSPRDRRDAPPARRRGLIDTRSEFERLALIWGQAAGALGRSLEFDWQAGAAPVLGARKNLVEAAANLLSNAIRHGEGRVRVIAREVDGVLRVEVLDQGPGLPRPVAALAANRRGGMRRLGPHGHGLAVAVRAAQRLGGEISSAPSAEGAALVLELPVLRGGMRGHAEPRGLDGVGLPCPAGMRGDDT